MKASQAFESKLWKNFSPFEILNKLRVIYELSERKLIVQKQKVNQTLNEMKITNKS